MTKIQLHLLATTTRLLQKAYFTGDVVKAWNLQRIVNQIRRNAGEQIDGWGLPKSTLMDSGKVDSKGRAIGFMISTNFDGKQYCVLVQNTRDGEEFGAAQRSKLVPTLDAANSLGQRIARERIAKLA